jgi:hypothetical protein
VKARRNTSKRAAIGLGLAGATIGAISAAIAGERHALERVAIGAATGGVLGVGLGALLPKNAAGRMMNPYNNPVATSSALLAGAVVAVVPPIVALEIISRQPPPPSAYGSIGLRSFEVARKRNAWIWNSDTIGGRASTRREALRAALCELGQYAGCNDHVDIKIVRPTADLAIAPCLGGGWTWSAKDRRGTSSNRIEAVDAALAQIQEFGDPH